jgi:hypothetical protein
VKRKREEQQHDDGAEKKGRWNALNSHFLYGNIYLPAYTIVFTIVPINEQRHNETMRPVLFFFSGRPIPNKVDDLLPKRAIFELSL